MTALSSKTQTDAYVIDNNCLHGDYFRMHLRVPQITAAAQPGQFVHLQVPNLTGHLLRRPFSICDVQDEVLTLVYKVVGTGTATLKEVAGGTRVNMTGPLGHSFSPLTDSGRRSILLGGGYGCAAMLFAAHQAVMTGKKAPFVLLGARTAADILLVREFEELGCQVRISTDDGSLGTPGRITVLLEEMLKEFPDAHLAACGPKPMLRAVAKLSEDYPRSSCEVSLDEMMCCGVGACFGCVIKCKADTPEGWSYRRSCVDGPVFKASDLFWE